MKKFTNLLFSMQTMGILILIFAFSIGTATFIENDFGTTAAKAVVYNAVWFDILLGLLAINLIGNIIKFKMYRLKKLPVFTFHLAFLIILMGAAITRFVSFEGTMHIRRGALSNHILSDKTYVIAGVTANGKTIRSEKKVLLSVLSPNDYSDNIKLGNTRVSITTKEFIPNATESVTASEKGEPYAVLVASAGMGRKNYYMKPGMEQRIGAYLLKWNKNEKGAFVMNYRNDTLWFKSVDSVSRMSMGTAGYEMLAPNQWHPFEKRYLYQIGSLNLVLTEFYPTGKITYQPYDPKKATLMDALVLNVNVNGNQKEVVLRGGKGYEGTQETVDINGVKVTLTYGSKNIELPFSIKLNEFQLERYPGSNSPSSYASEVTLIDPEENLEMPFRIYMNHVLNHRGYRFFQSSYDPDEKGTILSVNHDAWGTGVSYVGYFLMSLGMFLAVFSRNTRFAALGRIINKSAKNLKTGAVVLLLPLLFMSNLALGQHNQHLSVKDLKPVDKQEAKAFGELVVLSRDGRIKPVNTLSSEILRKITKKAGFEGLTPDQVLLGMVSDPVSWQQVPMIKIRFGIARNTELQHILGVKGDYASYLDFIDMKTGKYKLGSYVQEAYNKKPIHRGLFDKDIMKVDEKLNICYMVYTGDMLRLLPNPTDVYKPWFSTSSSISGLPPQDSAMVAQILPAYFNAIKQGDYKQAAELREGIELYQQKFGGEILPSKTKIKVEILYNQWMIFDNLSKVYGLLGIIMLTLIFINIFKNSKKLSKVVNLFTFLIALGFLAQTVGLGMRWYISGHAPWSDGYESMVYIGWITMLAGLLFSKKSAMTVAATTVLTSVILMVAHLTWMEPEITNLVPVLKSYWLTIHVSVITASYGFLALSMLLGFLNLVLMLFKNEKNREFMDFRINELTAINERSMIVGLYMLTIGTFLGGVWANESWGRYWGWDPKETWALVSVLVYSFITHMRFIPGLKSKFTFNLASLIGYFSILMTYFGVNFYLSGLHSYAKGDPVPIPNFVYYTLVVIFAIAVSAYFKEDKLKNPKV